MLIFFSHELEVFVSKDINSFMPDVADTADTSTFKG